MSAVESAIVGSARGKRSAEATDQIKGLPDTADRTQRRYPGVSRVRIPGRVATHASAIPSRHLVRKTCTSASSSSEMLCVRPVYTRPESSE